LPISGAALAGWPLSQVIEHYGWSGMFSLLSVAAVLMGLLLMPLLMAGITTSRSPTTSQEG
jgi:OPA family sugar phosphate sensor protein UhpC-like MFS transporter